MRIPWKIIGVAGLAGVAASGVVVVRKRRANPDLPPDELRDRLHQRLAETAESGEPMESLRPEPGDSTPPR